MLGIIPSMAPTINPRLHTQNKPFSNPGRTAYPQNPDIAQPTTTQSFTPLITSHGGRGPDMTAPHSPTQVALSLTPRSQTLQRETQTMPQVIDWSIPGSDGRTILGNTHMPDGGHEKAIGVILICHGFKGYKDYGFFPHMAQAAASAGLIAHRFNFSHSGMTNNTDTFEHPDLFEQDTWRKQSNDLKAVIAAVESGELQGQHKPLTIFGHSRGGLTTLLTAGDQGASKQLAAVITAASPSAASRLDPDQIEMLKRLGRLPSPSSRTGQTLHVGRIWQDEIDEDPTWHDPCQAIAAINCPVLLIHGTDDTTVPISEAHELHQAKPDAKLEIIPGAGHTFNAPNPLPLNQSPPPETQQMIAAACGFAVDCCKSKT